MKKIFLPFIFTALLFSIPSFSTTPSAWEPTSLKGGLISSLSSSDSRIFAGSAIGLYVSKDKGDSFQSKVLAFDSSGKIDFVRVLATASDANAIYVASSKGLHVSDDGGNRFQMRKIGNRQVEQPFLHTLRTIRFPNRVNGVLLGEYSFVYAASANGIARSADGGKNWETMVTWPDLGPLKKLDVQSEGKMYVVAEKGMYLAKWGEDWRPVIIPHSVTVHQVAARAGGSVFIIAGEKESASLMISRDDGSTWNLISHENVFRDSSMVLFKDVLYVSGPEGINFFNLNTNKFTVDRTLQAGALSLLLLPDESLIFAGTAGQGVWRKRLR